MGTQENGARGGQPRSQFRYQPHIPTIPVRKGASARRLRERRRRSTQTAGEEYMGRGSPTRQMQSGTGPRGESVSTMTRRRTRNTARPGVQAMPPAKGSDWVDGVCIVHASGTCMPNSILARPNMVATPLE